MRREASLPMRFACPSGAGQRLTPAHIHAIIMDGSAGEGVAMKENDCFLKGEGVWFRYRACGLIIEEGCVLFAGNDKDDYYYSVGGAVRVGETAQEAARREVLEETGVSYEPERLVFVHENLFEGTGTLAGYPICHEVALYFLMKPRGTRTLRPHGTTNGGERETMHWLPAERLREYRAFPAFLADYLPELPQGVTHIVTRNEQTGTRKRAHQK